MGRAESWGSGPKGRGKTGWRDSGEESRKPEMFSDMLLVLLGKTLKEVTLDTGGTEGLMFTERGDVA